MELSYLKELTLADLARFDGERIGVAMEQAMRRVADDIYDRPGEDRPRKVVLEMALVPVCDDGGNCEDVKFQIQVKDTIPTRKSKVYSLGIRRRNGETKLMYSDAAPDDHRQPGLLPEGDLMED